MQRILSVMAELDYIQKGDARVNGQYRFASHDQVSAAIHPLLVKHGIAILPSVEEVTQEGNRTSVKLLMTFVNADDTKDCFASRFVGYGVDSGDKGPGKAISYACKYGYLKTFCLETGEDSDMDAKARYEPAKCLEFDLRLPNMTEKEKAKMNKFLSYSAEVMNKHVEDVKHEALNRMDDFLKAFANWNPKQKDA
jgi:hypothetical protein